ncbi:dynein regulatory complex protein 8 isoform X6 [Symphalangus syndactylus]|uniref:dynein regulatory complex protein 8 isoform X6 n=1 Tax=Symphalangus syndactylus TaxID=9590 RepID=UPI0030058BCB
MLTRRWSSRNSPSPLELKIFGHTKTCTQMLVAASFIIGKTWKQPRCPLVEEEEPTGYIRFEKFLPVMTEILLERKYRPIPEDVLLRAFEVLDSAKRGFLTKDELIKYMTDEGEPFSQEEMEEMLSAAIDPESNSINYKDYITMMVIDEN